MATPSEVLNLARGEIGYSRWTDPEPGSKYGRWYARLTGNSYYGTSGVPYCAMFTSWVFFNANQSCPGLPGAYCPWILSAGRNAGQLVSTSQAQAGDVVLFDWDKNGEADHVGIVESNNGSYLTCIEGNTSDGNNSNGGLVMRRTRAYSTVIGIIRPKWGSEIMTDKEMEILGNSILDRGVEIANGTWVPVGKVIAGTYDEVMRKDDPSGRNVLMKDHDHLKWMAKVQGEQTEKLDAIIEVLGRIADKLG